MSVVFACGVTNVRRRGAKKETPEEDALNGMWRMADYMRTPNLAALSGWEKGTPGIMMIAPIVARRMAEIGWTRRLNELTDVEARRLAEAAVDGFQDAMRESAPQFASEVPFP